MKSSNYKQASLRLLSKTRKPMDVEKIRVGCKIGNWQTALKHCLELQYEGRIEAAKSSKSWIFWSKLSQANTLQEQRRRTVKVRDGTD